MPSDSSETDDRGESRSLLGRLFGALNPTDQAAEEAAADEAAQSRGDASGFRVLRTVRVEDVAVPKSDIVAVPDTIGLDALIEVFRESGRTRVPVYEGSLDHPLGMVNLKDVALRHGFGAPQPFALREMLRPLLYVPPSMPLAALLQRMQAERIHMALIIDEYGGTDGLATIEDLIETLVGEIDDEHDVAAPKAFAREGDGVWVADGSADLVAFEREIGLDLTAHEDLDAEEVDTLGGLVFYLSGHVPQAGEVVVHPSGPLFEVLDADSRRIRRLRVRLGPADRVPAA